MEISLALDGLLAFMLVTMRLLAFFLIAPPFSTNTIPMRFRGMLAVAVALPVFPAYIAEATFAGLPELVTAILWQILCGLILGFIVLGLFNAVQLAGQMIDFFSMFAMSALFDPVSGVQASVFGRIYNMIAMALLFASGAHLLLLRGLMASFEVVPVAAVDLGRVSQILVGNMDRMVMSALQIGGPIIAVLFLTDLALGLVSRAVPTLNVFQLAFPIKTLLVVSLAALGVAMMPTAVDTVVGTILRQMSGAAGLLGG